MKYELKIPNPCHEDWSKMSPTEQGKFCQACKKEVIDFTGMTDQEILTKLDNEKETNVCGRFRKPQISKELEVKEGLKISKMAATIALTAILAGSEPLFAQGEVIRMGKVEHRIQEGELSNVNALTAKGQEITIKGKVIENVSLSALPKAKVFVNGTQYKVETDKEGYFTLSFKRSGLEKDTLVVWYLGYKPAQIPVAANETMKIELEPDAVILDNPKMEEARSKKNKHILDQVTKLFGLKNRTIEKKDDEEK